MAVSERRRTWGFLRYTYLGAGILTAAAAISSFISPGAVSPYLYAAAAVLVIGVALLATDSFFDRVHRIFWRREWPK